EIEQVFKLLLGLAGETDDEGRADGDAGDPGADAGDECLDVFARSLAPHEFEHARMDVLERNVDVAADVAARGDAGDEFVAPMRGMGVEQANPKLAFDLVERAQELGQRGS